MCTVQEFSVAVAGLGVTGSEGFVSQEIPGFDSSLTQAARGNNRVKVDRSNIWGHCRCCNVLYVVVFAFS